MKYLPPWLRPQARFGGQPPLAAALRPEMGRCPRRGRMRERASASFVPNLFFIQYSLFFILSRTAPGNETNRFCRGRCPHRPAGRPPVTKRTAPSYRTLHLPLYAVGADPCVRPSDGPTFRIRTHPQSTSWSGSSLSAPLRLGPKNHRSWTFSAKPGGLWPSEEKATKRALQI
jgi:hypothetical protein